MVRGTDILRDKETIYFITLPKIIPAFALKDPEKPKPIEKPVPVVTPPPPQETPKEKPVESTPIQQKPLKMSPEEKETMRKGKIPFYMEELNKQHPVDASAPIRNLGPADIELDYTGGTYTITWKATYTEDKSTLALYYGNVDGSTIKYELIKKLIPTNEEKYVWDVSQLPKGAYTIQAYFFDSAEYVYARGAVYLKK